MEFEFILRLRSNKIFRLGYFFDEFILKLIQF